VWGGKSASKELIGEKMGSCSAIGAGGKKKDPLREYSA